MVSAKIYISGQISSLPREHYMDRFQLAEQKLRELGYVNIVNPTRIWACRFPRFHRFLVRLLGERRAYSAILLYDLWLLMGCQRIYKIPGWKASRGAQIESATAYNFNLFLITNTDRAIIDYAIEQLIKKQDPTSSTSPKERGEDQAKPDEHKRQRKR